MGSNFCYETEANFSGIRTYTCRWPFTYYFCQNRRIVFQKSKGDHAALKIYQYREVFGSCNGEKRGQ